MSTTSSPGGPRAAKAEWFRATGTRRIYLKIHPDVAAEVRRGTFLSGYHHYLAAGRAEGREGGMVPSNWNEALYLKIHPDVAAEVQRGTFLSGYHHYLAAGRAEGREGGTPPSDWNEALYLKIHPDVAAEVQTGHVRERLSPLSRRRTGRGPRRRCAAE